MIRMVLRGIGLVLAGWFFAIAAPGTAFAACQVTPGKAHNVVVHFVGDKNTGSSITLPNGTSFSRNPPQCTNPVDSKTYTMSCDDPTEVSAADSLFAPLCGSSEERGRANSTCWSCSDGRIACDGLDYAAGATDPFLKDNRCPLPGDPPGRTSEVWQPCSYPRNGSNFTYNGQPYTYNGGMIVICGANNLACGASESCANLYDSSITNGGSSGSDYSCITAEGGRSDDYSITDAACTGSTAIDLLPYVGPNGGSVAASVFSSTASWIAAVNNRIEWVNDKCFKQISNDKENYFCVEGGQIRLIYDTTFANEFKCGPTGPPVYQRPYQSGGSGEGIPFFSQMTSCGASSTVTGGTQAYIYNGSPTNQICTEPLYSIQTNQPAGDIGAVTTSSSRIIFQGRVLCNGRPKDVVVRQNTGGAGTNEVFVYCKNEGLCAWYQGIDFSSGTKAPQYWSTGTDLCSGTLVGISSNFSCQNGTEGGQTVSDPVAVPKIVNFLSATGSLFNINLNLLVEFFGFIKPKADVEIHPDMRRYARKLADTKNPSMPLLLQEKSRDFVKPQTTTITSRLCVINPQTGQLVDVPSKEIIESKPIRETNPLVQYGDWLSSLFQSKRTLPDVDFDSRRVNERMDASQAFPCNTEDIGTNLTTQPIIGQGKNCWGPGCNPTDIPPIRFTLDATKVLGAAFELLSQWIAKGECIKNPQKCKDAANKQVDAFVRFTIRNSHAEEYWCRLTGQAGGCMQGGFGRSNKAQEFSDQGSIYETFLPNTLSYSAQKPHAKLPWEFEQNIVGNNIVAGQVQRYKDEQVRLSSMYTMDCNPLPLSKQRPECDRDWREELPVIPEDSLGQVPVSGTTLPPAGNGQLDFTIDITNKSCRVNDAMIQKAFNIFDRYYPSYAALGKQNLMSQARSIVDAKASQFGNAIFALTLWIEESAAGGSPGSYGMGCLAHRFTAKPTQTGGSPAATSEQVDCLKTYVTSAPNFLGFMCRYSGEQRDGNDQCTSFVNNPNFPGHVKFWYDFLTTGTGVPASCLMQTVTN